MSSLIMTDRSRPEIDIAKYFDDYEFLEVPRSLITSLFMES